MNIVVKKKWFLLLITIVSFSPLVQAQLSVNDLHEKIYGEVGCVTINPEEPCPCIKFNVTEKERLIASGSLSGGDINSSYAVEASLSPLEAGGPVFDLNFTSDSGKKSNFLWFTRSNEMSNKDIKQELTLVDSCR